MDNGPIAGKLSGRASARSAPRRTTKSRSLVAAAIACALVAGQAPLAWAQAPATAKPGAAAPSDKAAKPDLNAAKKHYSDGEKKYKAGDYAGAIEDFKLANEVKSTPQAERYLGLSEDGLGHYPAAVDWYDKFLAHVPDKLAAEGDEVRKREDAIKAMPGKVHIDSTPAGASVTVDDKPQTAPTPLDVDLPPGTHALKFSLTGHVATTKSVDVAFASTQTVSAQLDAEAPPPPPPVAAAPVAAAVPATAPAPEAPPAEPRSKVPAFVTGGLAVAAAAVGTVFGVIALNDKSNFDKNPTTTTADDGDTHALISDMAFGVALTFGVTSAVLFLTKDQAPAAASTTSSAAPAKQDASAPKPVTFAAAPFVGPHVGGAGFSLRF